MFVLYYRAVFIFGLFMFLFVLSGAVNASSTLCVDLVNANVRDVISMVAEASNKSVAIDQKVEGKITLNLRDISWREALDTVVRMQGLVKHETPSTIVILVADGFNKNEHLLSHPAVFNLHHASADSVSKMLKPAGMLSENGKSGVDVNSNALVVADSDYRIDGVRRLLKHIDVPSKQIVIEARIVSADENFMRELGVEFREHKQNPATDTKGSAGSTQISHGQFNFAIAKLKEGALLDAELAALEREGRGRVISRPKLLTRDRQSAYIEAGSEIPYQEKTKEGNTSTSFKKAVLSLKVTPEVVATDGLHLSLELNQDKVGQLVVNGVPTIDTRKIHTQVLVHDNETIVLGGIYEWSKSNHITKVPVLGSIPVFGLLFSKKETRMERRELLIFVTPHIL